MKKLLVLAIVFTSFTALANKPKWYSGFDYHNIISQVKFNLDPQARQTLANYGICSLPVLASLGSWYLREQGSLYSQNIAVNKVVYLRNTSVFAVQSSALVFHIFTKIENQHCYATDPVLRKVIF